MAPATSPYGDRFFTAIRAGCQTSAAAVAPIVHHGLAPATVVDVGCGEGWWAHAFAGLGADVVGIDGATPATTPFPRLNLDLSRTLDVERRFDLAVCLEVAEHLPPARADSFVADLTRLAPVVLFSAAQPHQGGTGHVNCQPPAYWTDRFAEHGYEASGALRWQIWTDPDVEPWYKSNLLVLADPDAIAGTGAADWFSSPLAHPWHVTHPDLWLTR